MCMSIRGALPPFLPIAVLGLDVGREAWTHGFFEAGGKISRQSLRFFWLYQPKNL